MFKKDQGAEEPGDHWAGPTRIIGFDGDIVWGQFNAGTVASATHLLRAPTAPDGKTVVRRLSHPPRGVR